MLKITTSRDASALAVNAAGRLDTLTAPELAQALANLSGVSSLTLDLSGVDYISSAGLRVLLSTQKTMEKQGRLAVRGASGSVLDVLKITGFDQILNLE
jgi:anti-sigma B factor antagonist